MTLVKDPTPEDLNEAWESEYSTTRFVLTKEGGFLTNTEFVLDQFHGRSKGIGKKVGTNIDIYRIHASEEYEWGGTLYVTPDKWWLGWLDLRSGKIEQEQLR